MIIYFFISGEDNDDMIYINNTEHLSRPFVYINDNHSIYPLHVYSRSRDGLDFGILKLEVYYSNKCVYSANVIPSRDNLYNNGYLYAKQLHIISEEDNKFLIGFFKTYHLLTTLQEKDITNNKKTKI